MLMSDQHESLNATVWPKMLRFSLFYRQVQPATKRKWMNVNQCVIGTYATVLHNQKRKV
jgi:hypothetical protein